MPYFLILGMFFALLNPAFSLASEDVEAYDAGDNAGYLPPEEDIMPMPADNPPLPFVDPEYFNFSDFADEGETEPLPDDYTPTPVESSTQPIDMTPVASDTPAPADQERPKIAKDQALTDTLKQDPVAGGVTDILPLPKVEGTWVDKISITNPLNVLSGGDSISSNKKAGNAPTSLEGMVDNARQNKSSRSNASVFDISGVMLRMSFKQVEETMQYRGFKKLMQKYQIPNFIKWRNEEACRNLGVVGYERLDACVVERAKKDKQQYVQLAKYSKFDTKEEIEVSFTSNYTDNKVYKIDYKSMAASVTGNSAKAVYLRNIKIYDFWKKINQKYGAPDNKEQVTWGMGGNKPFLKAKTGYLVLEDPMFRELDYTRMSREDQRYMNTDLYNF